MTEFIAIALIVALFIAYLVGQNPDEFFHKVEFAVTNGKIPVKAKPGDAAYDISSSADITIPSGSFYCVPTGFMMAIPDGYEGQIRPRSGLAAKFGVTVLNSPGTIDSGFRGEVKVILINHGKSDFEIKKGDRIAQLVISSLSAIEFKQVEILASTDRGDSGFGSTGVK